LDICEEIPSSAPPPDVRKGSAFRSLQAEPNPAMQPDFLNPSNGSWKILNVPPSNTNNHRSYFPNNFHILRKIHCQKRTFVLLNYKTLGINDLTKINGRNLQG
jgi:hypothetical protein